jgi:Peptidase A4 family
LSKTLDLRTATRFTVLVGLALLAGLAWSHGGGAPVVSSSTLVHPPPRIGARDGTSSNWSGYAVVSNLTDPQSGAVDAAQGTWTVPEPSCASDGYSSTWVGIDGYSNGTVEQIGTEQDCSSGTNIYYAWFEMYPKSSWVLNTALYPVGPGDQLTAKVQYEGNGVYLLQLDNAPASGDAWHFETTQKANRAERSSAEWVEEAPSAGGVLSLANFGSVDFSDATVTPSSGTATAIGAWGAYDPITMINGAGAAIPSGLAGGNAFIVEYAPAATVTVATDKSSYLLGTDTEAAVTVHVEDADGNPISGASGDLQVTLNGQPAPVTFTDESGGNYTGTLQIGSLPRGTYTVTVAAVDYSSLLAGRGSATFSVSKSGHGGGNPH